MLEGAHWCICAPLYSKEKYMENDKCIVKNDFVMRKNDDGVFIVLNSGKVSDCSTLYFLTGVGECVLNLFDTDISFGRLCDLLFLKFPDISQDVLKQDLTSFLINCEGYGIVSIS